VTSQTTIEAGVIWECEGYPWHELDINPQARGKPYFVDPAAFPSYFAALLNAQDSDDARHAGARIHAAIVHDHSGSIYLGALPVSRVLLRLLPCCPSEARAWIYAILGDLLLFDWYQAGGDHAKHQCVRAIYGIRMVAFSSTQLGKSENERTSALDALIALCQIIHHDGTGRDIPSDSDRTAFIDNVAWYCSKCAADASDLKRADVVTRLALPQWLRARIDAQRTQRGVASG
jgi:hypothetical protein